MKDGFTIVDELCDFSPAHALDEPDKFYNTVDIDIPYNPVSEKYRDRPVTQKITSFKGSAAKVYVSFLYMYTVAQNKVELYVRTVRWFSFSLIVKMFRSKKSKNVGKGRGWWALKPPEMLEGAYSSGFGSAVTAKLPERAKIPLLDISSL